MTTKTTDNKGRLTLGERFANRIVIVEDIDRRIRPPQGEGCRCPRRKAEKGPSQKLA